MNERVEPTEKKLNDIVLVSEIAPEKLNIIPISSRPIFPNITLPISFNDSIAIKAIKDAIKNQGGFFGVVLIKRENKKSYYNSELYKVGTLLKIVKETQIENNILTVLVQSFYRFTFIRKLEHDETFIRWEVKNHYDQYDKNDTSLKPHILAVMSSIRKLLAINSLFQEQIKLLLAHQTSEKPHIIIDLVSSILSAPGQKLQELLETFNLQKRAEKLLLLLEEELELHKLQDKIQKGIKQKITKQQKEYLLHEQLKAIKKELGIEKDDKTSEIEKFQNKIKSLELSEEAAKVIDEQLTKLQLLDTQSPEYQVTRNYLNELTSLPWGILSEQNLDIKKARTILNEQHYGLSDVKDRILQFIGIIIKRGKVAGSIICLVGPPGVGKTSIGRSIAEALGRKFYRFSVGGMRDEAEIKGHRRTYIGAMPGKIIQSLKRTYTANPVIMLDEIDKIGTSYHGDPSSALLEVLDPEQNVDFLDHFLDVRFDLSNILFVTTANQLDTIPRPLLDRMEIIKLSGYILQEKVEIARRHLIGRQLEQHGLSERELKFQDSALTTIADQYAREAGVRNFEKQLKKIMRQVTLQKALGNKKNVVITNKNIEEFLGKPLFTKEHIYNKPTCGVSLGLAWTPLGGTTLYIEATALKVGTAGFKQTGQLGGVMKESSEIAYSYIRGHLSSNETSKDFFSQNTIHLHVPAGATPKDGPSAGITMGLALYSLATAQPIPTDIAMTGELTLTGKVLPIGGVKEKIIAAKRVNITTIILPKENRRDYDELAEYIKEDININYVDYFSDVLKVVFQQETTANSRVKRQIVTKKKVRSQSRVVKKVKTATKTPKKKTTKTRKKKAKK